MFLIYIKSKKSNILRYMNLFRLHSGTRDTLVRIGFGFGFLDTKILNPFGYLINFGSGSVLLFRIGFGLVLRIRVFCPALCISCFFLLLGLFEMYELYLLYVSECMVNSVGVFYFLSSSSFHDVYMKLKF